MKWLNDYRLISSVCFQSDNSFTRRLRLLRESTPCTILASNQNVGQMEWLNLYRLIKGTKHPASQGQHQNPTQIQYQNPFYDLSHLAIKIYTPIIMVFPLLWTLHHFLTSICDILGMSWSVICGQKIHTYFLPEKFLLNCFGK